MWALEYNEKRAGRLPAKPISGGFVPPERGTPEFDKTRQVALRRGVPGVVGRGVQTARQGLAAAYSSARDAILRPPSDDAVYKRIQGLAT